MRKYVHFERPRITHIGSLNDIMITPCSWFKIAQLLTVLA